MITVKEIDGKVYSLAFDRFWPLNNQEKFGTIRRSQIPSGFSPYLKVIKYCSVDGVKRPIDHIKDGNG